MNRSLLRPLSLSLLAGLLLAACDTAPPETAPPTVDLPCAGVTADGTWEALSPPDLLASRIRRHGDFLFAVSAYEREGLWRRDLTSGQPPDAPWEWLGLGLDPDLGTETALDVLADPDDPDRLLATVSPGGFPGEDRPSVLRSTDGGQT